MRGFAEPDLLQHRPGAGVQGRLVGVPPDKNARVEPLDGRIGAALAIRRRKPALDEVTDESGAELGLVVRGGHVAMGSPVFRKRNRYFVCVGRVVFGRQFDTGRRRIFAGCCVDSGTWRRLGDDRLGVRRMSTGQPRARHEADYGNRDHDGTHVLSRRPLAGS